MPKLTVGRAVKGAIGLVRGTLAPETDLSRARLAVCEGCPFFDANQRRCKSCGCFVDAKTRITAEQCPEGYW